MLIVSYMPFCQSWQYSFFYYDSIMFVFENSKQLVFGPIVEKD
jgi:hypothetical protein